MFRALIMALTILIAAPSLAESGKHPNDWVRDWRLERPFMHGYVGVLSLNQIVLFPDEWDRAYEFEHNALAPGQVKLLEANKGFPFYLGITTGLGTWGFMLLACYRMYRYRYEVSYYVNRLSELEDAKDA